MRTGELAKSDSNTASALADELLAIRCQLGEPEALAALVDRWHESLWQFIRGMANDEEIAAETLQNTWLRILRALPSLRDPARLRPWLFGIARRAMMDRLREAYRDALEISGDVDAYPAADDAIDDADDLTNSISALREALDALPMGAREVLVLFYLQELTLNQIADVLSVPVGTVKSRLFTARTLLRRALHDKDMPR